MLQILTCRADLAQRFGVDEAIFLHNIVYWTLKNKAEGRHFHQGRWWTYASRKGLAEMYPFWSESQIKRMTARLREQGALLAGDFNEDRRLRTSWYSPSDEVLALYGERPWEAGQNRPMHCPELSSALDENGQCLYKVEQVESQEVPPVSPKGDASALVQSLCRAYAGEDGEVLEALLGLLENRSAIRKPVKTARAMNGILSKLDKLSGGDRTVKLALLEKATVSNWLTVFPLKEDELPKSGAVPYDLEGYDGI